MADEAAAPAPEKKGGMMTVAKIGGFIVVVVLGECLAAWLFMPKGTPATAQAAAGPKSEKEAESAPAEDEATQAGDEKAQAEVDLGEFRVTAYRPESNTTWYIDFHLYGTVTKQNLADFETRFKDCEHRYRDQVLLIVRSMNRNDLADPGLGLIKRQVLEKTNRTLGKTLLRSVMFSEFSFQEQ